MNSTSKKVVIIGGVVGGAACAARLRRLDEKAEIVLLEKGPYISFANCGLPYYLSGTVASRKTGNTVVSSGENHEGYYAVIQLRMIFIFTFRLLSFII